jgi:hypothetical protein
MEMQAFALRMLLGPGHGVDDDHEDDDHGEDAAADPHVHEEDNTRWLRIVAVFVILVSGLAGGLPPLFSKVRR